MVKNLENVINSDWCGLVLFKLYLKKLKIIENI